MASLTNTCEVDGCGQNILARGLCSFHYHRTRMGVPLDQPKRVMQRSKTGKCKVDGCDQDHFGRGFCERHFRRMKKHGHINDTRNPFGTGYSTKEGYVKLGIDGNQEMLHILLAKKALGKPLPKGAEVHHLDGNPSNNNPNNLVICPNHGYHGLIERRGRAYRACGHADWVKCRYCKQYDDPKNMYMEPNSYQARHNECRNKYNKQPRIIEGV